MGKKKSQSFTVPPMLSEVAAELGDLDPQHREAILALVDSKQLTAAEAMEMVRQELAGTHEAAYLGSVPVAAVNLSATMWSMFGAQVIGTAGPRLKALKRKPIPVTIVSSVAGIRVLDAKRPGEMLDDEPLENVVYAAVDASDKKRFAYLTHYSKLGLIYCHVFQAKKPDVVASAMMKLIEAKPKSEVDKADTPTGQTIGIFETRHLGSVPIKSAKGRKSREIVVSAIDDLQAAHKDLKGGKDHAEPVVLVVSSEGIRVVEQASREVLNTIPIGAVRYMTEMNTKKQEFFALIYKDETLNTKTVQLFLCQKGDGSALRERISEAHKLAQAAAKEKQGNPFQAIDGPDVPVTGPLANCQIPRKDLTAVKPLGAGQFGEVYLAEQADKTKCAVKMLRGGASAGDKAEFMQEIEIMANLNHPQLVQLVGICATRKPYLAVLEFVPYGDLHNLLVACRKEKMDLKVPEKLKYALDMAKGLRYVASQNIVHLDVAARNVLIQEGNSAKIADFGLATRFDEGHDYFVMKKAIKLSIRWLCTEAMGPPPKALSERSDVWSFGVAVWEIFAMGRRPYKQYRLQEVQQLVYNGQRLMRPRGCPEDVHALLMGCWAKDPSERPSFEALEAKLIELIAIYGAASRDVAKALKAATTAATDEDTGELESEQFKVDALDKLSKEYDYPQC